MPCNKVRAAQVWRVDMKLSYQRLYQAQEAGYLAQVKSNGGMVFFYPTMKGILEMRDRDLL